MVQVALSDGLLVGEVLGDLANHAATFESQLDLDRLTVLLA